MANVLPLSVSSKTTDIMVDGDPLELNPFANAGITAADAPVLLSLASKGTVDADAIAARMPKVGGHGTKAEARLFLNVFAEVLDDLIEEYGAVTVQTSLGTIQTFISGTMENPQDQPDPSVNYAFLGVVIPEAYRRVFANMGTYVPAAVCPASLKRVRDKATNGGAIRGTSSFYLEGKKMTMGGEGETLELLDAATRDVLCEVAVDPDTKSPVQFQCVLVPESAIEAGTYLLRLMTLAGGETTLWPLELKVELLEDVPEPVVPRILKVTDGSGTEGRIGAGDSQYRVYVANMPDLADKDLKVTWTRPDGSKIVTDKAMIDWESYEGYIAPSVPEEGAVAGETISLTVTYGSFETAPVSVEVV